MNDQEAIVLLKSDSHEAFEYLYKVYGGQVYNFSKLYINSSEDIKEVVQEVFVKLWEARSFLREDENFRGFLFCLLYTSPSPRDVEESRMPSSA